MCNYVHFQAAFIGSVYWFESNVYLTALLPLLNGSDLSAKGAMHGPPGKPLVKTTYIRLTAL
jgi:hypothetical protein